MLLMEDFYSCYSEFTRLTILLVKPGSTFLPPNDIIETDRPVVCMASIRDQEEKECETSKLYMNK